MRLIDILARIKAAARSIWCSLAQLWLLVVEVPAVFAVMAAFKRGRRPSEDHPWVSGSFDGDDIWPRNIVYRSPTRRSDHSLADDEAIVSSIGRFLRSMVRRSIAGSDIPQGTRRRMPHGVNLLHGSVHYNGVFLIFDDFADLVSHITDRRFRRDLLRFGRTEKREMTLVFRNRKYDPVDYAYCVGCVRANIPWFSNGNGPTKRPVLWGNMSPYPAINLINGAWMHDMLELWRSPDTVAKPPVDSLEHFRGDYFGRRSHFTFWDRAKAYIMFTDVRSRGFRGQLFFTNRRVIEPQRIGEYRESGGYWRWTACNEVPPPWTGASTPKSSSGGERISVVIPALNEAHRIGACIDSVLKHLRPDELIVVDGGSEDETTAVAADRGAQVLSSGGGRGGQCRFGADHATGDILVFLHADAVLGSGARTALLETIRDDDVATFRQRTVSSRRRYLFMDAASRLDTPVTRFGDTGIALSRAAYEELGGMPNLQLFEDVHLLRKARRRGRIAHIDAEIYVSPRDYERLGFVRKFVRDGNLIRRYFRGASAGDLYDEYYR